MKSRRALAALTGSLLCATAAAQPAEYGIEGMGTVSTRDSEIRA
ncbi:MAG TPA: TolB-like protein, partial [Pseudoxanthomonas sp.]